MLRIKLKKFKVKIWKIFEAEVLKSLLKNGIKIMKSEYFRQERKESDPFGGGHVQTRFFHFSKFCDFLLKNKV